MLKQYPKMPEDEAEHVGRSGKLPLEVKLRLAAVAHVRHVRTDYEELLHRLEKEDAREEVRDDVEAELREWEASPDRPSFRPR